jgi:hypothetical protein
MTNFTNETSILSNDDPTALLSPIAGFGCLLLTSLFWGSLFLPVKQYDVGDGVFFQFIPSCALLIMGFIVNFARDFPTYHPLSVVGGVLMGVKTNYLDQKY